MERYDWADSPAAVDWDELADLYRIAPLGTPPAAELKTIYGNCMFACFAYSGGALVAAGRALADGADCAYLSGVVVHPQHQGKGLGKEVIRRLVVAAAGYKKIILYANPGKEGFYAGLGFLPMNTAMAIWRDQAAAVAAGLLRSLP
jgi:GNAT superfamily N-acetyltransferase